MNQKWLFRAAVSIAILFSGNILTAQVLTKPDPSVNPQPSKGIVILIPKINGSLYLNDYFLTELKKEDTTYIYNLTPGTYRARITNDSLSLKNEFSVTAGKVTQIKLDSGTWYIDQTNLNWHQVTANIAQKECLQIRKGKFYNITQLSILNLQLNKVNPHDYDDSPELRIFNSLTTINGYQVVPGFCMGLGITFNNYDVKVFDQTNSYNVNSSWEIENVPFLPVFADIRAHLPQRGRNVAFFFKFDIGYNFLLSKKYAWQYYTDPYSSITKSYFHQMDQGGIIVSPGIGLRIFISELVQITPSIEYSAEKSQIAQTNFSDGDLTYKSTYNNIYHFLKINIGIAFQY